MSSSNMTILLIILTKLGKVSEILKVILKRKLLKLKVLYQILSVMLFLFRMGSCMLRWLITHSFWNKLGLLFMIDKRYKT